MAPMFGKVEPCASYGIFNRTGDHHLQRRCIHGELGGDGEGQAV
jgi:hypothetical protein